MAGSLASGGVLGATQKKQIGSFAERIARLIEERKEVTTSIAEVFNEASEAGFERKALRKAVKRVMADQEALKAEEELVDSYVEAIRELPLFKAANEREAAPKAA